MTGVRRPAWTQTIRFRLAAAYSLVLFALAALVLAVVYGVVSQRVDAAPLDPITVTKVKEVDGRLVLKEGEQFQAADLASVQQAVNHQALEVLRDASALALGGLLLGSFAVGWWLAGRVLRPVQRVTAAAREISATDLSRRIALVAQRQMIADASHELRSPLAIIQINLDAVLSRDDVDAAERRRASTVTARATQRMGSLIEDLLAAARRAAPAFTDTDVDLGLVAGEAADAFALLAEGDGVRLERRITPVPGVIGDPEALRRAVDNLLSNAVRVSPAGAEIVLATGRRGGWAFLAVRDNGPGIAPEHQERVFDRFWRGTDGTRRRDRGTGLGLAIVRQVVESHGGSVALHSAPGEGATFVLWLPLRTAGPGSAERSLRPPLVDPLVAGSTVPS